MKRVHDLVGKDRRHAEAEETFDLGWGHLSYGQYLHSTGQSERAVEHLLRAREAFASLEAQTKLELIERLLSSAA